MIRRSSLLHFFDFVLKSTCRVCANALRKVDKMPFGILKYDGMELVPGTGKSFGETGVYPVFDVSLQLA